MQLAACSVGTYLNELSREFLRKDIHLHGTICMTWHVKFQSRSEHIANEEMMEMCHHEPALKKVLLFQQLFKLFFGKKYKEANTKILSHNRGIIRQCSGI